jgi:hypothetical protein
VALDLAVAVAGGAPCLRRFVVPDPGRVLLYAGEDAPSVVRRRLEGIAAAAGVALSELDIQVITAPTLRLDVDADRRNLACTVAHLKPRLLILDPFVRLHRIDENASGEVAPLLAYLRALQRRYGHAVLVVHHAKKCAAHARGGQALRGSSEFHAWGDSNLCLRREGDELTLTIEHRAAPSQKPMKIELCQSGEALALQVVEQAASSSPVPRSLDERITSALSGTGTLLPFAELRSQCRVRTATLSGWPRSPLTAASSSVTRASGSPRDGRLPRDLERRDHHLVAGTSHFRFPYALQRAGSRTGNG